MPSEDPIRLQKSQIGPAAEMLSRAFMHDPKMAGWIGGEQERAELSRPILEFELRYGLRYGEVYATSPALEGVAIWLPGKCASLTVLRALFAGGMRYRREVGREIFEKSLAYGDFLDRQRARLVKVPYWYLFVIGVDPGFQGKGYASLLIRPMLARLDREGLACYLNTESDKNIRKYEHFDFRLLEHATIPGQGFENWVMLREPKK